MGHIDRSSPSPPYLPGGGGWILAIIPERREGGMETGKEANDCWNSDLWSARVLLAVPRGTECEMWFLIRLALALAINTEWVHGEAEECKELN